MTNLFKVLPYEVTIFVRSPKRTVMGHIVKMWVVYRASDTQSVNAIRQLLDEFESALFVLNTDEMKYNPFNPYRKIIKLTGACDIQAATSYILNAIELFLVEHNHYILSIVTNVDGEWSLWVSPEGARAIDALLALKAYDTAKITHVTAQMVGTNVESREHKIRSVAEGAILPNTKPKGGITL